MPNIALRTQLQKQALFSSETLRTRVLTHRSTSLRRFCILDVFAFPARGGVISCRAPRLIAKMSSTYTRIEEARPKPRVPTKTKQRARKRGGSVACGGALQCRPMRRGVTRARGGTDIARREHLSTRTYHPQHGGDRHAAAAAGLDHQLAVWSAKRR